MLRNIALFSILLLISLPIFSQIPIDHWETIVEAKQEWQYLPAVTEPPADWMTANFLDSNWSTGPGGIGFGDEDDRTEIDSVTALYLRTTFSVVDTATIIHGLIHADYDDAFIAYLNGVEVARSNIGVVGDRPAFDALPTYFHEAVMYQEGRPEYFEIDKTLFNNLLKEGTNTLAIQVQNDGINSSDLSAIFFLSVGIKNNTRDYSPTPEWFQAPVFLQHSDLPIIQINTSNQIILDDPRIVASMKITNNEGINSVEDTPNEYDGRINIELRGSSSQRRFNKKSYGFETQLPNGDNNNISLLGMPEENDWILYGPFSDKTLLRNDLVYHLSREMGQYASRTAFCELLINDQYQGVYILMEKIKRDKNRVNIAKLNTHDNEGDELTGGYIVKIDKTTGTGGDGWHSTITTPQYEDRRLFFQYEYPEAEDITAPQKTYIQQYIDDFENTLFSDNFKDPVEGYRKYIDVESFIDFFIANELSFNVDGYRLSVFLHKQKDSDGGKLRMGPIWDFNLSIGNGWDCDIQNSTGFMYDYNERCGGTNFQIPFWWKRLLEDEAFVQELRCTWDDYRQDFLKTATVLDYLDQRAAYLTNAKDRNFVRWPILEVKVHFNFFLGDSYEQELNYVKEWLDFRLAWLDRNMFGYCGNLEARQDELTGIVFPNPAEDQVTFEFYLPEDSRVNLYLYDTHGRLITQLIDNALGRVGYLSHTFSIADLPKGVYFLRLNAVNEKLAFKILKI